mgnify:CR=1 FL=1
MSLKDWIQESNNIVFFGGAGVSTESNIPDFRSDNGLYKKKYPYPAEIMLSHSFYLSHPKEFFDFYFSLYFNSPILEVGTYPASALITSSILFTIAEQVSSTVEGLSIIKLVLGSP